MLPGVANVPADVVRRVENVERAALTDLYAACPETLRREAGIEAERIGDGVLLVCRSVDSLLLNRFQGLGVEVRPQEEELDRALELFAEAGVTNWLVQVAPGTEPLADLAIARGLVLHQRVWAKFVLDPVAVPPAESDIVVREIGDDEAMTFGEPVAEVFGLPPPVPEWLAHIVGRPGWRVFVGFDGRVPAGAAAVWIDGGAAWLGFAGTRKSHRGRGLQKLLLARRIAAAIDAGCDLISTETGVPLPGESGPSFRNIQRAGFRVAYERPNFCRPQA
jgi:hypothetical protein